MSEVQQSLSQALDATFLEPLARDQEFITSLARLIGELAAAKGVTVFHSPPRETARLVVGQISDGKADHAAARRAESSGAVEPDPPSRLAVKLAASEQDTVIAVVEMPPANPIAVSLAHERLELIRVLCKLRASGQKMDLPPDLFSSAIALAQGDLEAAQPFADAVSTALRGTAVIVADIDQGRVGQLSISGQAVVSNRAAARGDLVERIERSLRVPESDPQVLLLGSEDRGAAIVVSDGAIAPGLAAPLSAIFEADRRPPRRWGWFGRKLRILLVLAALVAAGFIPVSDGVNLPATIAADQRRLITAPFDGRIAEIPVASGDRVTAGETVLMRMDTRQLENERAELRSDLSAAIARLETVRGARNAPELREAEEAVKKATLRRDAMEEKIARASVLAPIDGIVLGEDVEERRSSFVSLGSLVFEVIDPSTLSIEVFVSPRARGKLDPTAAGAFRPDAAPNVEIPFDLRSIGVAPLPGERTTAFLGKSDLIKTSTEISLRPGMEGVARFEFEDLPLAELVWRRVRDWALLTFWL